MTAVSPTSTNSDTATVILGGGLGHRCGRVAMVCGWVTALTATTDKGDGHL